MKRGHPAPAAVVAIQAQQRDNDCVACALSTLLGVRYEDVTFAAARVEKKYLGRYGVHWKQIKVIALLLGFDLQEKRQADLEDDTGILLVKQGLKHKHHHTVVLQKGHIIDHDNTSWEADVYLANIDGIPSSLYYLPE